MSTLPRRGGGEEFGTANLKNRRTEEPKTDRSFLGSWVLGFLGSLAYSLKALHGIDHGFEYFELLVEARDLENLAIGGIAGGDFQITLQGLQRFLGGEERFQASRFDGFTAVEINNDVG